MRESVKEKAEKLQEKYGLSNEQIKQIENILYCICQNIIDNHIKKCIEKYQTK